ncbi:MAG: metallopeptidase family protein [Myxococcales bacterium]
MDREEAMSDEDLDELEALLSEVEQCLSEGDVEGARAALEAAEEMAGPDDPDVGYGRALIMLETGDVENAVSELKRVLETDPDFADAHHTLGLALEELGDEQGMIDHFMRTRVLDAKLDKDRNVGTPDELALIERVARETIESLPEEFGERLKNVPIILEHRPSRSIVESGFDPRAFGLFEGPEHGRDDVPAPTRVVLFTSNLLASFADDDLEEQVEITVLHEVGHYFGLDEDDMVRLGLD